MKKVATKVLPVKNKKKKIKWREIFMAAFVIITMGGGMVWMTVRIYQQEKADQVAVERHRANLPATGVVLDHKTVCMSSNVYMGEEQLAVTVNGKTYYSCSPHCTADIHSGENARLATDPFSKNMVDKSQAFISLNPDDLETILYFESDENLKKYFTE